MKSTTHQKEEEEENGDLILKYKEKKNRTTPINTHGTNTQHAAQCNANCIIDALLLCTRTIKAIYINEPINSI